MISHGCIFVLASFVSSIPSFAVANRMSCSQSANVWESQSFDIVIVIIGMDILLSWMDGQLFTNFACMLRHCIDCPQSQKSIDDVEQHYVMCI